MINISNLRAAAADCEDGGWERSIRPPVCFLLVALGSACGSASSRGLQSELVCIRRWMTGLSSYPTTSPHMRTPFKREKRIRMMQREKQRERKPSTSWRGSLRGNHGVCLCCGLSEHSEWHSVDSRTRPCFAGVLLESQGAGTAVGDPLVSCEQGPELKMLWIVLS